jgi:co-chaperonin GroES (HSP10)
MSMNMQLFGHRCLVEYYQPPQDSASRIIVPDNARQHDTHRMGIVRVIGNGKVKGKAGLIPSLVKVGDLVSFQINHMMETTQTYVLEGKHYLNLLQDDLIARIHGDNYIVDNMEMLGDYVLLKHFMRQPAGSALFLPETVVRQSAPEFIYFRCVAKGSTVDLPIQPGDELLVNFGRLTPLFITHRDEKGNIENQEFAYTRKEWVDGVVEAPAALQDNHIEPPLQTP